jgi:hypothetical protein
MARAADRCETGCETGPTFGDGVRRAGRELHTGGKIPARR